MVHIRLKKKKKKSWYSMGVDCFVCSLTTAEHKAVFATQHVLTTEFLQVEQGITATQRKQHRESKNDLYLIKPAVLLYNLKWSPKEESSCAMIQT